MMFNDFQGAWKQACGTKGGVFRIQPGTYTLSGTILFEGPCNGYTTVTIDGYVKASDELTLPSGYWIGFLNVDGLTINGRGTLDGNGPPVWGRTDNAPVLLNFEKVSNLRVEDITLKNSKMFHMKIVDSQHVTVQHVHISAPGNSPNTDGVHIGRAYDIRIINSFIASGDDCISIGDGSSNVNISGIFCGPGHGISIGSLGKFQGEKDVSSVHVSNCTLTNTLNGIRIKTIGPNSVPLKVYNVTYEHIIIDNVYYPIIFDQNYCPSKKCARADSNVKIQGVKIIDVRGSSGQPVSVNLDCSGTKRCEDIQFSELNLKFKGQATTAGCSNADAKFIGSNQVPSKCSGPAVPIDPIGAV
ncbi:hypothetical protein CASFOL_022386 [Castilleja foliolosa]|uniref:Uncharacterized protein n=1 Tax=Castilleja foliolosa TaxID=1961234 RepID=A0ABD3CWY3_9LAMI